MAVSRFYCIDHAIQEHLVAATNICDGRSVCLGHTNTVSSRCSEIASDGQTAACSRCELVAHRAYFVVDTLTLCVRHAAEQEFGDDDMGAHDMAHAAYISLNAAGVVGAY